MAVDLKFELFAHDLFCKIFFENNVRDKICDGRVHYADECMMDIPSHQQQIYDDCFYQVVVCRQYFFRRVFHSIFEKNTDFYTASFSDFCDYVHIIFDRQDLFGHLHLFDRMFASCAFVADLCLFCYSIGNRNFIKIAHLCWALYFDRFSEEFYIKGGWRSFRKLALSYSLPFIFLTTHIEPRMPNSYTFVSLTRLHLAFASFSDFWNSGLKAKRTFSKNWIEFRRNNSEAFQSVDRQNDKVYEEPKNAEQAEILLMHLIYFCHPIISKTRTANGKAESHSSEDLTEFLSGEENDSYFSDDEWITSLLVLKDKELLKINEKNRIQIPKSEENLPQVCETEIFHPSEKDPLLQQISDAESLLQEFAETDKINRLLSEYEDLKKMYDHNQKFTDGENDLNVHELEKSSLQHFEQVKILKQLSEYKNKIIELYKKNQAKFSKKTNGTISELRMNSEQDNDNVSLTPSNCESMSNISPEIISLGAESCDNYFSVKDQNSFSHCTNHQDSDVQNIHKSFSQSLQIPKDTSQSTDENGNSQPEHGKKDVVAAVPENDFTLAEYQRKISSFNAYQEEHFSSDKNKKSASNENEWASSFDIHLNPENPIAENQNNSTYEKETLLSDNEVKKERKKGNFPSSDPYPISEKNLKEAVPINSNQENFGLLITEPDQDLNQNEGKQTKSSVTADDKHASAVEDKIGDILESRKQMNICDQPNIKINKRKKERKKKKRNSSEKVPPTVGAQTEYHTSEEMVEHFTKRSPTKKLTLPEENNFSRVVKDNSPEILNKTVAAKHSIVQKATSALVMGDKTAIALADMQNNFKGMKGDEKTFYESFKNKNTLSSTENSSLTLQQENTLSVSNPDSNKDFSSIVNSPRAISPDRKSVASTDQDQNLRCVSPKSRDKTFFASENQNNNLPDTEYQKRKISETRIVKSETEEISEAFRKLEIEAKKLLNDNKNSCYHPTEPNDYSLAKHEQTVSSTIGKLKDSCSISNDSEISSLKIEDRKKNSFLEKDQRSVYPIDDNPENCSSNPTKTHCPPINNRRRIEQHTKTEEKTSFPLNKQKVPYLSASIKDDIGENIEIEKSGSSAKIKDPNCLVTATNTEERSFSPSEDQKSGMLLSVSVAGKVESNQVSEIEAFGSTSSQQDQNIPCIDKSLDKEIQSQNALSSSISQQEANNKDLDVLLGASEIMNLDASEKIDSKVNSSGINCPHSESQSKEGILNNKVQCNDFEPFSSANAITLENTYKSNKCDSFLQTSMHSRNLNQGPTLQPIDEKKILINNILILGVKNKRTYLTSIFKNT